MVQCLDFKCNSEKEKKIGHERTTKIRLGSTLLTIVVNIDRSEISLNTCSENCNTAILFLMVLHSKISPSIFQGKLKIDGDI